VPTDEEDDHTDPRSQSTSATGNITRTDERCSNPITSEQLDQLGDALLEAVTTLSSLFPALDPEVVHNVLSACDWHIDRAVVILKEMSAEATKSSGTPACTASTDAGCALEGSCLGEPPTGSSAPAGRGALASLIDTMFPDLDALVGNRQHRVDMAEADGAADRAATVPSRVAVSRRPYLPTETDVDSGDTDSASGTGTADERAYRRMIQWLRVRDNAEQAGTAGRMRLRELATLSGLHTAMRLWRVHLQTAALTASRGGRFDLSEELPHLALCHAGSGGAEAAGGMHTLEPSVWDGCSPLERCGRNGGLLCGSRLSGR